MAYHYDCLDVIPMEPKAGVVNLATHGLLDGEGDEVVDHVALLLRLPPPRRCCHVVVDDMIDETIQRTPRLVEPLVETLRVDPPEPCRHEVDDIEGAHELGELLHYLHEIFLPLMGPRPERRPVDDIPCQFED